ncbi:hypothetical protein XA68_12735 [Ophiocordyceps unilateralis]|uniref:Uncharacterized protein n=1 Tax=Ophiocordyceps unilateralis TaxID=268505 RepID=A0A2A9PD88_OPHUN|nr:hypothetical protein XA68_12735 [Ophiocordyceps unilateralis]
MDKGYTYKSSGTNSQGNHYCSRDYGSDVANTNSYHYSNTDGSYYYSNSNGSTYYNDGQGASVYTAPDGQSYEKSASGGNGK